MNSVILAGGFGSRLKPFTDSVPKPMLPIANVPMLDYVVSHLYACGIDDVVLTLGYYPEQVSTWMNGYKSIKSHFIVEDVPLGTAGGVREASDLVDERFLVVSGDALENIDYRAMLAMHRRSGKLVTIAVTEVEDARQFGLVKIGDDSTVTEFTEKPSEPVGGIVNCGVYILERAALRYVPRGEKFDFARDLFPQLVQKGQVNAYRHNGFWSDIGTPAAYYKANFAMLGGAFYGKVSNNLRVPSRKIGYTDTSLAAYSALVVGKCRRSIVGDNAAISSGADISDCVVLPGTTVSGMHFGEIIGNGYSMPILANLPDYSHDSTVIYKNFS